ncbi:MAG: anthranilate synthase component I family protein [Verrucomicrobiota bacterium]
MPARSLPSAEEASSWQPVEVARQLAHLDGFCFLDTSGHEREGRDRFSLLAAHPERVVEGHLQEDLASFRALWEATQSEPGGDLGLPGPSWIGSVEYDGHFAFGYYPRPLCFDHQSARWLGDLSLLSERKPTAPPSDSQEPAGRNPFPPGPAPRPGLTRQEFEAAVRRAQAYIAAGDIYQVNLSQQFSLPAPSSLDSFALYERLRQASPAPHAAFLRQAGRDVLSASPETFLRMSGRQLLTRPIKGTRPRYRDPQTDERSAYELLTSAKELAELVMITDLERNDLGQVAEIGSVTVSELLKLERFAQVFHLVSTVEATLREPLDHLDVLQACSPGGSITGAPKKRAREIIAELEPIPRGLYTGAIGYLGAKGESQFSIAIRTMVREGGQLHFHAGAGIVADSVPEREYEETLQKASGLFQALARPWPEARACST